MAPCPVGMRSLTLDSETATGQLLPRPAPEAAGHGPWIRELYRPRFKSGSATEGYVTLEEFLTIFSLGLLAVQ